MVLFTGCSEDTTMIKEEDGFYLQFNTPTEKPVHIGLQMAPKIRFESLGQMLQTIRSGKFTQAQMEKLIEFDWDEQGRVILFDLDHVLEPVCPSGYGDMAVIWSGKSYAFLFQSPFEAKESDFFIITEESYYIEQTEHYQNFDEFRECDRVTTENRDGTEVTVFDYTYSAYNGGYAFPTPYKLCTYTLTDDNTELFIVETYEPNVDLETPASVKVYGKSAYGYFHITVKGATSRPSPEWLLEFDLKPYNFVQYETSMYSIVEEGGQCILTPKSLPEYALDHNSDFNYSSALIYPKYTSVREMQQEILQGTISEYELFSLTGGADSVEICNPNHLYEVTAPEEFVLENITWMGKGYRYALEGETANGGISFHTENDYRESFRSGYKDFLTNSNITITRKYKTLNRFATVYYGETSVAKLKYVCYTLRVGGKKMYIQEHYLLDSTALGRVSSEIPEYVEFWSEENDGNFYGIFYDFTKRPTASWLGQFGIVPFST